MKITKRIDVPRSPAKDFFGYYVSSSGCGACLQPCCRPAGGCVRVTLLRSVRHLSSIFPLNGSLHLELDALIRVPHTMTCA